MLEDCKLQLSESTTRHAKQACMTVLDISNLGRRQPRQARSGCNKAGWNRIAKQSCMDEAGAATPRGGYLCVCGVADWSGYRTAPAHARISARILAPKSYHDRVQLDQRPTCPWPGFLKIWSPNLIAFTILDLSKFGSKSDPWRTFSLAMPTMLRPCQSCERVQTKTGGKNSGVLGSGSGS